MASISNWRVCNGVHLEELVPTRFIFPDGHQCIIRPLTRDDADKALNLILEAISARHDPIISALDFDADSFKSLIHCMMAHLEQGIAYGCFQVDAKEGAGYEEDKLIAVDALYVRNDRDEFKLSEDPSEAFGNWLTYIRRVEKHLWSMGQGKICNFLSSFGVFILDQKRDIIVISTEMMQMRKKVAEALQIKVVGAAFIGNEIQEEVEKDGPHGNNKYKILYTYENNDCKELGLGNISEEENIKLTTIFPIKVMGLKQNYTSNTKEKIYRRNRKGKINKRKYGKKLNKGCQDCRVKQYSI